MRRTALLFLCSLAPGGALAGCFGNSTPPGSDAGGIDASTDTSLPPFDSSVRETSADAGPDGDAHEEAAVDATADAASDVEVVDAPAPVDAPPDAPPTGTFPTTPIDFGLVNCGSAPGQTQTYSFANTGIVPITYTATVGTSALFSITSGDSGTVAPGKQGSIVLTAATVPATSTAGSPITGTLTLTTDVPGSTLVAVPLTLTPQGGSITLTPATAAFGSVDLTVAAPAVPLTLTNAGNAAVSVSFGAPTDPQFSLAYTGSPGAVSLAPGATLPAAAANFTPASAGLQSATAAILTTGVLCASPATSLAMNGTGTTEPVTVGPATLSFGTVSCGAQSSQVLPVTISNGYGFAVGFSASIAGGTSRYTLDVTSGNVPAQGSTTIHVTPQPIPGTASIAAGAFDDTLTVSTTAPGNPTTNVALQESAQGAILGLTMASGAFSSVVAGSTGKLPFTVTNTGNLDAPITLSATPAASGFGAVFTGTSTAASGGGTAPGNATFTPVAAGTVPGSFSIGTTAVRCAPLPAAVTLSGTGVGPVATYSGATLAVGVTCGGAASNVAMLTITNNTAYPLTAQGSSQNGLFTFTSASSITVPANSSGSFSVQAPAVAIGGKASGTYADALLFKTNEFGTPTHSVPVQLTVSGANLSFTAGANLSFSACQTTQPYTIHNSGNMAATVTEPNPGNPYFAALDPLNGANDVSLAAGASVSDTVEIESQCTGGGTYTFTTSGPVCQGVTLPMTISWDIIPCPQGACC